MVFALYILAQPLAPDCIGLGILFLAALAFLRGLSSLRNRFAECHPARHPLRGWGHRLHERTLHRPH
jgi:hypothetical protein